MLVFIALGSLLIIVMSFAHLNGSRNVHAVVVSKITEGRNELFTDEEASAKQVEFIKMALNREEGSMGLLICCAGILFVFSVVGYVACDRIHKGTGSG